MAWIHHLIIDFQAYYNGLPQEIIKYKIFKYVNGESVYENRREKNTKQELMLLDGVNGNVYRERERNAHILM